MGRVLAKLGLNWIKSNPFKSFKWVELKPIHKIFLWSDFELIETLIRKTQLIMLCIYIEFDWENKVSKGNLVQGQYSPFYYDVSKGKLVKNCKLINWGKFV